MDEGPAALKQTLGFDAGDLDGSISEKGIINVFKRAKQSGAFILVHGGLLALPEGLCDFANYRVTEENWWDGNNLVRIDLSNNVIEEIDPKIGD